MRRHKGARVAALAVACVGLTLGVARASPVTLSGYFNDQGNPALVGSDLAAPLFGDDWEIANNVALYDLEILSAGVVAFESHGYAAGGAQPYFSLFAGSLVSVGTATFVTSNYFDPNIDFNMSVAPGAGSYIVALGVWENMSFAENLGVGTLGDGFIFLGVPGFLGNSYYELEVTPGGDQPPAVPEPATFLLVGSGIAALSGIRRLKKP